MNTLLLLTIAFVVLQILDAYTTRKVLSQGGTELNPFLAKLMEKFGVDKTLFVFKGFVIGVFGYLYTIGSLNETLMIVLDLVYLVVVVNNFRQIKK